MTIYVAVVSNLEDTDGPRYGHMHHIRLVGPFGDVNTASRFFSAYDALTGELLNNPNNPVDNPCWQVLDLEEPSVTIVVPEDYTP